MILTANSLYIADEIQDLVETGQLRNKRLVTMLKELAIDNERIYTANVAALKLKDGELSEEDMLIYLNKYRSYNGSIVE